MILLRHITEKKTYYSLHLEYVRPWFLHDMCQTEQMKQSFSHKTLSLTVAAQRFADLSLVGFTGDLYVQ